MPELVSPRHETNSRFLWIQLLAGPVLWSVHFLLSYLLMVFLSDTLCALAYMTGDALVDR